MEELEQHLKAVLHRIDPPPGFEARAVRRRSRPGLKWAAALATAAMIVAGVYWQGEIAKERVAAERASSTIEARRQGQLGLLEVVR